MSHCGLLSNRKELRISPLLPLVLRGCRELPSAINELRWLREHVVESLPEPRDKHHQQRKLLRLCKRRARGEPLQYILGTQPFGELEIKCRPGVLIPRPETEAYTTHIAHLLLEHKPKLLVEKYTAGDLRVIDYCSGSGCISLLLYALLSRKFPRLKVEGVDISPQALSLANENLQHNVNQGYLSPSAISSLGPKVSFIPKDILSERDDSGADIIISNPPYISQDGFNKDTSRSVRTWEPKLALVPKQQYQENQVERNKCAPEDIFYYHLLQMHQSPRSKLMLMEVGDLAQAKRVAEIAARFMEDFKILIEIWRDWPDQEPDSDALKVVKIRSGESSTSCHDVQIKGYGIARSVVVYCGDFIELAAAP